MGSFSLEQTDSLTSPVLWRAVSDTVVNAGGKLWVLIRPSTQTRFYRLRAGATAAATIIETSPAFGESGVAVTRETIFRLSAPLAASAIITSDHLYAEFGARRLLSRVELSGDRKTVTLFYLENLPGSARILVTFNGGEVKDAAGADIDADGDGQPGGRRVLEFETAGLVGLPNTGVIGHVYASEKGPGGANQPLRNVTVTVDGAEEALRTVTDANGFFKLQPAPAGRFFVHVDGRTAVGSEWPGGAYYPFVGQAWEGVAGRTNTLANGTGEIFLPLIPSGALQAVSATEVTRIAFSPAVVAANPALAGVEVRVPANALFSENGTRGGKVGMAPVPPDRLPEPLPPGLELPLVITIQTDGPMNFDRPVQVRFPNLPDPATGQVLPPGAKSALWSFNHDRGRWEIQGPMTVTADGLYVECDPGVGVRQPGWHGNRDGSQGHNDDEPYDDDWNDHDNDETDDDDPDDRDPCKKQRDRWDSAMADCFFSTTAISAKAFLPGIGCAVSIGQGIGFAGQECEDFIERCEKTIITQAVSSILGCIPILGGVTSAMWICLLDAQRAEGAYNFCKSRHPPLSSLHAPPLDFPVENPADIPYRYSLEQAQLFADAATLYAQVIGDAKWTVVIPPDEWPKCQSVFQALQQSMDAASVGGEQVLQSERNSILSLDRPANITEADLLALIDRFDKIMGGTLPPQEFNFAAIKAAAIKLQGTALELQSRGWETVYHGLIRALAEASEDEDASLEGGGGGGGQARLAAPSRPNKASASDEAGRVRAPLYYRLTDMFGGFVRRGQLSSRGTLDSLIVAADTLYSMEYFHPASSQKGRSFFLSGPNGSRFKLPRFILLASEPADTDSDGLPDEGEGIIGTNPNLRDTDGDGVNDGAEIQSGTNPLDGLPAAAGLIASVDTPGTAVDICAFDDIVAVADSAAGISIFNISNPTSPVLVATVATPDAATAVAGEGNLLVAAVGSQLAIIDISNPLTAHVIQMIPVKGTAQTVVAGGGLAYVGTSKGRLYAIDLTNGVILEEITLPGSTVGDLALANGKLYVLTQNALVVYGGVGDRLQQLGTVAVSGEPVNDRRRLFVGGGHAYVGYFTGFSIIDVTDATSPRLVGSPPAGQLAVHDIAANGSGLVVNSTSFRGEVSLDVSLYDVSDPTDVTRFLTTIETPGFGRGLALYNGLAFVASGPAGLEVINYRPYDGHGKPPSIALAADFPLNRPEVEEGKFLRLTARVADDVQVGRVEFYSNGVRVRTDGNFPFEHQLLAPLVSQTNSLRIRARAIDTGGNATWSDDIAVTVEKYLKVIGTSPATNVLVAAASVSTVTATFSEPINLATLNTDSWRLFEAGPDGMHGTADDLLMPGGVISWQEELRTASLAFPTLLGAGSYRATLSTSVTGRTANRLATEHAWTFSVRTPVLWNVDSNGFWDELAKWSTRSVPTSNDVVVIDRPTGDYAVTVRRNQTVLNLSSQEALALTGGTLSILGSAEINSAFSIYGGSVEFNGPVLDAGSILTITNGLAKFNHPQVAVPGALFVSGSVGRGGGRVDFNHDGAVTPSSLHLAESGTIGGSGLVAPIGPVLWDGGTMTGLGVTRFQASSEIKGAGTKAIREERIVENAGRCVWTGSGNIQF
ncbi:MAG: Ig-like domain-containing protein, partial [Verrucomicrobiales bacterium]|nr:Ig-like domain-containing protein [Verrucomicrobiales bacterium]